MKGLERVIMPLFLCSLISSTEVQADTPRWLYLSAGFGWDKARDLDLDSSDATMSFDQGVFQPSLAIGYKTTGSWRFELERVVHHNTPEILYSSADLIESDSDERDELRSTSLMFNAVHDFTVGEAFRPYLGAGIGWSKVHFHFSRPEIDEESLFIPREDRIDDDDTTVALQFIAGFTIPLTRRLDLALDYRYFTAPSVKFEDLSGEDLDTGYGVHSTWLNLRYHAADAGVYGSARPRANTRTGWYVAGQAGGAFAEDSDIKGTESVIDAFDVGPLGSLAIGYAFNERWNLELAGSHQHHGIDVLEVSGAIGEDKASGALDMSALMLNAIRHFAPDSAIRPYIGIGAGMSRAAYEIDARTFCRNFVCGTVEDRYAFVDDNATGIAFQALIGVDIVISSRLSFTADYRYWRALGFEMDAPTGGEIEVNRQNSNAITAGLRYRLGNTD